MNALKLKPTEFTPEVLLDAKNNKFEISGESRPEDTGEFYKPILKWLDQYFSLRYWKDDQVKENSSDIIFEFKFEYFNSTSAKYIMDILLKLEKFLIEKKKVKVCWYYEHNDIDMLESGERFASMVSVPFDFIEL